MNIVVPLLTLLYGQLTQDSTANAAMKAALWDAAGGWRVYESTPTPTGALPGVPDSPRFPMLRIAYQFGTNTIGNGGRRLTTCARVQFDAITDTENLLLIQPAADRIDALFGERFTGASGALQVRGSWGVSFDTHTQAGSSLPISWKRLGGTYEFFCYDNTMGGL